MKLIPDQWWDELSPRERGLMIGAAMLLVIGSLYWGIWHPLEQRLQRAEAGVHSQQQLLQWVGRQADTLVRLRAAGPRPAASESVSLGQIVTSTAGRFDIRPSRMQPQGEKLQVWIDSTRFDNLLRWLQQLQQGYGVTVTVADISRDDTAGMVKVRRLELSRE